MNHSFTIIHEHIVLMTPPMRFFTIVNDFNVRHQPCYDYAFQSPCFERVYIPDTKQEVNVRNISRSTKPASVDLIKSALSTINCFKY